MDLYPILSASPIMSAARGSSASHLSQGFAKASAGEAESDFYGIPLSNDLSHAAPMELAGLALLLVAIIMKPHIGFLKKPQMSASFWVAALTIAFSVKELILVPLLTTIIYTRTSYPYLVVVPHCIVAAATYRKERSNQKVKQHWLPSFGLAFLCYGFGGSIVSDILMGLPVTALGHPRIVPCYVLGWVLVWYSPFDILYQTYSDPTSFLHYFLNACEAVDSVTTPMGRVARGARELQNKLTAPILGGFFAGIGGGMIRYVERVVLQNSQGQAAPSLKALEAGVFKTLGYATLWWWLVVYRCEYDVLVDEDLNHCSTYNGSDLLRVVIVIAHIVWTLASDFGWVGGHPFIWASHNYLTMLEAPLAVTLQLGPKRLSESKEIHKEKTEKVKKLKKAKKRN